MDSFDAETAKCLLRKLDNNISVISETHAIRFI